MDLIEAPPGQKPFYEVEVNRENQFGKNVVFACMMGARPRDLVSGVIGTKTGSPTATFNGWSFGGSGDYF